MVVQPIIQLPDGTVGTGLEVTMGVIVGGIQCDRMGRLKMVAMKGGNNSKLACHFCHMNGVRVGGSIRQLGYVENKKARQGKCRKKVLIMGVDDEERGFSHEQQKIRAKAVNAFLAQ